jgi:hypothetical protein
MGSFRDSESKPKGGRFRQMETGGSAVTAAARRRVANTPDQVRAISKGFTFGFADEIDAAGAAVETGITNTVKRLTGRQPAYGMKDAYGAVMDANAEADARFAQEHPVQNFGLQVVGGAVGPGVATAARYVGRARGLGSATARSAAVGTATGAVAGAGNSRGGAQERAVGAGKGAVTGAVVGAAVPGAARLAQTAGRGVNAAIGQPFGGANRGAAARLREALQQDGLTEPQIRQAIDNWQRSGVTPEFLNVVGENTRALIRAAAGQPGPARDAAQAYRNTTVASIPNRAIERANALTPGETRTPAQFVDDTTGARDAAARTNYAGPYSEVVEVPQAVSDMLNDSAGRALIARARADAVENQDWVAQADLERLLQGAVDGRLPQVSARTLDRLAIAARERGQGFARNSRGTRARGSFGRQDQINAVLDDVDGLQPARAEYRAQSQAIETAQDGPSVLGPRSEFEPAIDDLGGNLQALLAARIRERQALRDGFGVRDNVAGRLRDIAYAPDVRPNLNQLYGQAGDDFADASANLLAKQEQANFIAPNTGSQTQLRGADTNRLMGAVGTLFEMANGSLRPLLERFARGLTMTEAERNILVQVGIGTPDDAMRVLSAPPPPAAVAAGNVYRRIGVTVPSTIQGTAPR